MSGLADRLLTAALDTAERGWPVFPLVPGRKVPALHSLNDCPHTGVCADGHLGWEQRATTDPDRIRRTWTHKPYNIGLATGPAGLLIVDLDVPKPDDGPRPDKWNLLGVADGADVFTVVCQQAGQPVPWETRTVATPSGGTHLYFRTRTHLRNTGGDRGRGLGWKVDTRAWGGYVVAPGSVVDGQPYTLTESCDPVWLPEWLAQRLTPVAPPKASAGPIRPSTGNKSAYLQSAIDKEVDHVVKAKADRNYALLHAATALGQLVAGGSLSEQDVRDALIGACGGHVANGAFSWHQAELTIRSGLRYGAQRPRSVAA
jgi:hypothetical protein